MCGIAGVLSLEHGGGLRGNIVESAMASLRHRGPDDKGLWQSEGVALGFQRLSIIDLSSAGHQPMVDNDNQVAIIFNGEIYNYRELRVELTAKGYTFRSQTDTEVVLNSYREYGVDCLKRFNGMWAFALYDRRRKTLFCSRDRFGVKPFYYSIHGKKFFFASEIKALLAMGVPVTENKPKVFEYLAYGHLDTSSDTLFDGVVQLEPGSYIEVSAAGLRKDVYWTIPDIDNEEATIDFEEASAQFKWLFYDSVSLRLRSDVSVGVLLSGGLDSSAITCVVDDLLANGGGRTSASVRAFAAVYDDPTVDESEYIDAVLKERSLPCDKIYPGESDLASGIEKVVYHQDEPCYNTTVFSHWFLMKAIHTHNIKVILSGQGADEIMAGYTGLLFGYQLRDLLKKFAIGDLVEEVDRIRKVQGISAGEVLTQAAKSMTSRKLGVISKSILREGGAAFIPIDVWSKYWSSYSCKVDKKSFSNLNKALYRMLVKDSLPRILHYEDRNSMAFSIEERVPFLDYRIVELLFKLPNFFKTRGGISKVLLRHALKGVLPEKIRLRTTKTPFATPQDSWIRDQLGGYAMDLFRSRDFGTRWFLNGQKTLHMLEDFIVRGHPTSIPVWRILNLEVWHKTFFSGQRTLVHEGSK